MTCSKIKIVSILGLPLIFLYRVSYGLMGIHTTYHWGDIDVRPTTPVTQGQFLFSRLFPMLVAVAASLIIAWFVGKG